MAGEGYNIFFEMGVGTNLGEGLEMRGTIPTIPLPIVCLFVC